MPGIAANRKTVYLHAAGSLRAPLTEISSAYEARTGLKVQAKFGPSGLLREEIIRGAKAEVFASADLHNADAIRQAGMSFQIDCFARNRLCALVRPGLNVTPENLLDHMLDPAIRLGTSTPKADPSGDYAWLVFGNADRLRPGAFSLLAAKALQLTGGRDASPPPPDRSIYGLLVSAGEADIFLTYCTNASAAKRENPLLQVVGLPGELDLVTGCYLTVLKTASVGASRFATYISSPEARDVFARHGFEPPN